MFEVPEIAKHYAPSLHLFSKVLVDFDDFPDWSHLIGSIHMLSCVDEGALMISKDQPLIDRLYLICEDKTMDVMDRFFATHTLAHLVMYIVKNGNGIVDENMWRLIENCDKTFQMEELIEEEISRCYRWVSLDAFYSMLLGNERRGFFTIIFALFFC